MKKNIMIVFIILIVAVILIGILIANNRTNQNQNELQKIKVNEVTRSVFYAPQYVAISNGYFKEYGMELDLTTGQRSRCSNDISIIWRISDRICRTRSINICV